ncbi:MAG: fibronectin type III domain-containing protein [bacterium]|nr:fibronectin type III domain-containing protein [bacterium]
MSWKARQLSAEQRHKRLHGLVIGVGLILGASSVRAGELEIEWRAPEEPVLGFVIERRQGEETTPALIARVGPEARRFIDDDVAPGASACYRVRAILGDGSWAPSLERCAAPTIMVTPSEKPGSALPQVSAEPPEAAPEVPLEADHEQPDSKRVSDRFEPVQAETFPPAGGVRIPEPLEEAAKP